MLAYLKATPSVPQVSELIAQNEPQNQDMEFQDDFMLGELNLDYDEPDFDMETELISTKRIYWTKVCGTIKRKFKNFEYEAKSEGAKTNGEVAKWCRRKNTPCEVYVGKNKKTVQKCIKKGYFK